MDFPSTGVSAQTSRVLHLTDHPARMAVLHAALNNSTIHALLATQQGLLPHTTAGIQATEHIDEPQSPTWQNAWGQVPVWREVLLNAQSQVSFDIVHAHTFTAGMAAVRNFGCVVYELDDAIEIVLERATSGQNTPWLRRSFHVAEEFILTRAGAVVVHTSKMRDQLRGRGVPEENLFVLQPMESCNGDVAKQETQYSGIYHHARRVASRTEARPKLFLPRRYSL